MKRRFSWRLLCGLTFFLACIPPLVASNLSSVAYATELSNTDDKEVKLNVKSTTIVKGKTYTLKVYNLTASHKVSFKSSDSGVASVDENGVITAHKVGNATITANVKDGSKTTSLTCSVTVGPTALSVKFTKSNIILGLDKSDTLNVILKPNNTAEAPRYSSRNTNIATVSIRGRVNAKSLGMTYVFAEIGDLAENSYKYSTCSVIVVKPEDVPALEGFFQEHTELNLLSDLELTKALENFFNQYAFTDNSKKARSAEEDLSGKNKSENAESNVTGNDVSTIRVTTAPSSTPSVDFENANNETKAQSEVEGIYSYIEEDSLTSNLERYLDSTFNLKELKATLTKE